MLLGNACPAAQTQPFHKRCGVLFQLPDIFYECTDVCHIELGVDAQHHDYVDVVVNVDNRRC